MFTRTKLYFAVLFMVALFSGFSPSAVTGPVTSALGPIIGLIAVLVLVSVVAGVGWAIHRAFTK